MRINLSRLLDKIVYKIDISEKMDINKLEIGKRTLELVEPIDIKGQVFKTDDGNFIHVDITCEYKENCDRCLKSFTNKIETVLSGRLIEKSNKKFNDDDEILIHYQGDNLFLEEPVISTIILSLPMKSLCKDGCEGLCPVCGIDRNKEECDCEDNNIDPRLAKLKELFD
ncbi:YceD family protein [Sporosalibacterium faouarense]|uniref:YceD family protein n=1 Tax=Sporosalibacterium faouarense TaxID=516123 RepID=UPI00141CD71E|nr:DUF177 domain-containing protein [Sporosalibacterium faouarense]MTI47703.1 DUF177 domain-containing protein [Bacillota bacterium]